MNFNIEIDQNSKFGINRKLSQIDNGTDSILFCKFISKRRIISLRHSSILRQIWLNFTALCLVFIRRLFQFSLLFFGFPTFSTSASVVEMSIWCIKIVNVLVLHTTCNFGIDRRTP
jgi:hypothetical protein